MLQILRSNEQELVTSVLISSTIGPGAIWALKLNDEVLTWEMNTVLLNSEVYDTVITCSIASDYIFIGTYGEVIF